MENIPELPSRFAHLEEALHSSEALAAHLQYIFDHAGITPPPELPQALQHMGRVIELLTTAVQNATV